MKIEIVSTSASGLSTVRLTHGREFSDWDVSAYARTSDRAATLETDKIFEEINSYWAQLPNERQATIWQVYQEVRNVLDNNFEVMAIQSKLQKLVKKLYELMPMGDIKHWMTFKSNVRIPANVKDTYGEQDRIDGTYIKSDYRDLVVLAIALRPMVPIWGEYIGATRKHAGSTFKETMAMMLLYDSSIAVSEPMERLHRYVMASVQHMSGDQGPSATAVLGGLGSAELPDWLRSLTVVRRLSVGEISSQDDGSNIITNVYQYLLNTLKSIDRKFGSRFGGKVTEKKPQSSGSGEETQASVVEMYKVKQEVSDGELVTVNIYTEQTFEMTQRIDPTIDVDKLAACLHYVAAVEHMSIQPHQIHLTQWIMARAIPARGIPLLAKAALMRAMAVTQTILWHWEYYDLAAMVTASPLTTGKDSMVATMESRGRIPRDLMEELTRLFPHYQQIRGKQTTVRQMNPASIAVDKFCDMVTHSDWILNCPPELIARTSRLNQSKKLIVPGDIRTHLASLHIKLAR